MIANNKLSTVGIDQKRSNRSFQFKHSKGVMNGFALFPFELAELLKARQEQEATEKFAANESDPEPEHQSDFVEYAKAHSQIASNMRVIAAFNQLRQQEESKTQLFP